MPWAASTSRMTPSQAASDAADLVAEVDVAGRVDQVEGVALPGDPHVLDLDGDAPLALEVHRVEVLLAHVPGVDGAGQLEDAVGQRGLAVVDVGDDREVADAGRVHASVRRYRRPPRGRRRRAGSGRPRPATLSGPRRRAARKGHPVSWRTSRARSSATRPNEKRAERNKAVKSELKTRVEDGRHAAAEQGADDAADALRLAQKRLDKAATQGRHPQEPGRPPQEPPDEEHAAAAAATEPDARPRRRSGRRARPARA